MVPWLAVITVAFLKTMSEGGPAGRRIDKQRRTPRRNSCERSHWHVHVSQPDVGWTSAS